MNRMHMFVLAMVHSRCDIIHILLRKVSLQAAYFLCYRWCEEHFQSSVNRQSNRPEVSRAVGRGEVGRFLVRC